MNAPIMKFAELIQELALMLAMKNHAVLIHYVTLPIMLQSVSVLPATKEIQKFNAVS